MKVLDYKIITSESVTDINIQIKELMKDGWEPSGDLRICKRKQFSGSEIKEFYHAMIKYDKKDDRMTF